VALRVARIVSAVGASRVLSEKTAQKPDHRSDRDGHRHVGAWETIFDSGTGRAVNAAFGTRRPRRWLTWPGGPDADVMCGAGWQAAGDHASWDG
jgi:hypothetical protein